jgi:hypothetical protein
LRGHVFQHAGRAQALERMLGHDACEVGVPQLNVKGFRQDLHAHAAQVHGSHQVVLLLLGAEIDQETPQPPHLRQVRVARGCKEVALHTLSEVVLHGQVALVHLRRDAPLRSVGGDQRRELSTGRGDHGVQFFGSRSTLSCAVIPSH